MSQNRKKLIGWMAFLFLSWHCLSIFIFAFPYQFTPPVLKTAVTWYVSPIFEQTWSLFAPCPLQEGKIEVKYYFEDDSTDWINPLESELEMHSKLRFTHHGEFAIGYSNMLFYVANDLAVKGISVYEPFPSDSASAYRTTSSYWLMRQYIYGISDYTYGKYPLRARVKCHYHDVKTEEKGMLLLPEFNWKEE